MSSRVPGAWIVVASGVFVGALNGGLDTFMMFHADAYTTPWHWCLYTFAVEYGRADWAYPVLIYNFYRNTYLLLFFLPGFLVNKVNTDLGTAAAAQSTLTQMGLTGMLATRKAEIEAVYRELLSEEEDGGAEEYSA